LRVGSGGGTDGSISSVTSPKVKTKAVHSPALYTRSVIRGARLPPPVGINQWRRLRLVLKVHLARRQVTTGLGGVLWRLLVLLHRPKPTSHPAFRRRYLVFLRPASVFLSRNSETAFERSGGIEPKLVFRQVLTFMRYACCLRILDSNTLSCVLVCLYRNTKQRARLRLSCQHRLTSVLRSPSLACNA